MSAPEFDRVPGGRLRMSQAAEATHLSEVRLPCGNFYPGFL